MSYDPIVESLREQLQSWLITTVGVEKKKASGYIDQFFEKKPATSGDNVEKAGKTKATEQKTPKKEVKKVNGKPAEAKAKAPVIEEESDDSDADRPKPKTPIKSPAKSPAKPEKAPPKPVPKGKKVIDASDESSEEVKKEPKKSPNAKKPVKKQEDEDSDNDSPPIKSPPKKSTAVLEKIKEKGLAWKESGDYFVEETLGITANKKMQVLGGMLVKGKITPLTDQQRKQILIFKLKEAPSGKTAAKKDDEPDEPVSDDDEEAAQFLADDDA